ncbi:uncharacterized protein PAC_12926 [Phialocephala subalpina]|uniref:Uncharacterized protein n=1 Tax=Phialocephala subalpina TaxID=576137 RepID=A0A1L7XDB0_9HELO|nr:uncharacterized protein PAC_12926 [Phialocephala subalpina]
MSRGMNPAQCINLEVEPCPGRRVHGLEYAVKQPSIFTPPKNDVRVWIMETEDYFLADGVMDSQLQAVVARNYVSPSIKKRIMMARISNDQAELAMFNNWVLLKEWLFAEYGARSTSTEADISPPLRTLPPQFTNFHRVSVDHSATTGGTANYPRTKCSTTTKFGIASIAREKRRVRTTTRSSGKGAVEWLETTSTQCSNDDGITPRCK